MHDIFLVFQQDDTETGEQFVHFPSGETVFQQVAGITPQDGSISCSFKGFGADDSWNPGISLQADDNDSSSETSDSASDDSDVGIIENFPAKEDAGICQKEKFDQRKSPMMENVGCLTVSLASASVEMQENSAFGGIRNLRSTEDIDKIHDGNEHVSLASCQGNFSASLQEDPNLVEIVLNQDLEKAKVTRDNMQAIEGIHNLEGIDDTDRISYDKENGNIATCQEKFSASLQEDHALVENGLHQDLQKTEVIENDMQRIGDDVMMVESDEQQAAKRPRRTS
jgi:sentrin-specific protease 7